MATTIQEFAAERGIKCLMHFTRARNLDSIFARGLVPRNGLILEGFDGFNDLYRIDGTDAVCLSIDFEPPRESWRPVGLSQATTMEV